MTARVAALDADRIEPGGSVLARLTLDRPIGALARDRLVLRDATATRTIGGGVVIDPFPPRRGRRTPERLAQLAALDQPDPDGCIACAAGTAAWVDRPRRLPARAQPAAVDAVGHDGGRGRRSADVAGNAGGVAQRCGRASCRASRGGTGSAGAAARAAAHGDAGPAIRGCVSRHGRIAVPARRGGAGRTLASSAHASRNAVGAGRARVAAGARR